MYARNDARRTLLLVLVAATVLTLAATGGCRAKSDPVVLTPQPSASDVPTRPADAAELGSVRLELSQVVSGLQQPVFATGAKDGSSRLFVCEKTGRVRVIENGALVAAPFLDLSGSVSTDSERGLLGIAFSPQYARTGRFYVDYTDKSGNTVISRFVADASGTKADPASEEVLLRIEQPYANHNGGCVQFGPDKMLWIGMGDGGSGGDPQGNAQSLDTLLGKMLRIDVGESGAPANGEPYGIPADNPFANPTDEATAAQPEVWATGLRNPWRFSFDSKTKGLWIGDVGQSQWEEIDFVPAGSSGVPAGGLNFGWNTFEASHPYPAGTSVTVDTTRFTMPIIEYDHGAGNSVTGGVVVRDPAYPGLDGIYLYGDYGSGRVWGARPSSDAGKAGAPVGVENVEMLSTKYQVVSFGTGDNGEVYLVDFAGAVYRVTDKIAQ